MLLASVAILALPQQTFQGAGFAVDYFPERMVPQEITTEDVYIFQLLDPADPLALCPPLRVTTYLDTEKLGEGLELMKHTRDQTIAALKTRGLEPGENKDFGMTMLDSYDYVSYFECEHEDGSPWYYLFRGYRIDGHLLVVTTCRPTDKESERYTDVQLAMESLKWRGIDESTHIAYDVGGIRFPVPIHFNAELGGDARQMMLHAVGDEETVIEVRVFHTENAEQATTGAQQFLGELPEQIPQAVKALKASERDYSLGEGHPSLFAIDERTARGWRHHLRGRAGVHGWRHDVIVPVANLVVAVTTTARSSNYWRSLLRIEKLLERVPAEHIPGRTRTSIRDGLVFRYDAELELVRSGEAPLFRYEFRRRGLEPEPFAGLWVELRDDLDAEEREDYIATRFRNTLYGERQAGSAEWIHSYWLGDSVKGVQATYIGNEVLGLAGHQIMTSYAKPWGEHMILASFRGTRGESPELRGLLRQVMLGMEDVREGPATYRDAGVEYTVDPKLWTVEGDGQTSTATVRQTTLKTQWAPLSGGLLGPAEELATALRERVESDNLGRALLGEVEEPQWGAGEFEGGIPSRSAVVVYTDGEGVQRFALYVVADSDTRRIWVTVDALFDDPAANESVSAILATVVPK